MTKDRGARLVEKARVLMLAKRPQPARAFDLLTQAHALGNPEATYALGTWYLHGTHVKKNLRTAFALIRQAAVKKHGSALYDLAVGYETGSIGRVSLKKAFECYVGTALGGDSQATYEVGRCYFWGTGTAKDRALARLWIDKGLEMGAKE